MDISFDLFSGRMCCASQRPVLKRNNQQINAKNPHGAGLLAHVGIEKGLFFWE